MMLQCCVIIQLFRPMKPLFLLCLLLLSTLSSQKDIPELLVNKQFIGQYRSLNSLPLFDYLNVVSGNIQMIFVQVTSFNFNFTQSQTNQVKFQFFNPKYHDERSVQIIIDLGIFNQTGNIGWENENTSVTIERFNKGSFGGKYTCNASYKILIRSSTTFEDVHNLRVLIEIHSKTPSPECSFDLAAELNYYNDRISSIFYSSFISGLALLQLCFTYRVIKNHTSGRIISHKISLATITMMTIQDFYLVMTHVYFVILQDYYMYFILPIFLLVLQSIFFDMRLIFAVWRATNMHIAITTAEIKKRLTMFYVKFYLTLFGYLALMYFFHFQVWALILQPFLIYIPQIVKNVRKGNNPHFYKSFIIGVLGMRMFVVLYYKGCPENIYLMTPSTSFCIMWVMSFVALILILFLQHQFGARFFIPNRCIPGYFNYYINYKQTEGEDVPECSICLQSITVNVDLEPPRSSDIIINTSVNLSLNSQIQQSSQSFNSPLLGKPKPAKIMRTPCLHLFHQSCLKAWIDMKSECPTCRTQIPPVLS